MVLDRSKSKPYFFVRCKIILSPFNKIYFETFCSHQKLLYSLINCLFYLYKSIYDSMKTSNFTKTSVFRYCHTLIAMIRKLIFSMFSGGHLDITRKSNKMFGWLLFARLEYYTLHFLVFQVTLVLFEHIFVYFCVISFLQIF